MVSVQSSAGQVNVQSGAGYERVRLMYRVRQVRVNVEGKAW